MKDANMIRMLLCFNIKIGNDLQIYHQKFEKREKISKEEMKMQLSQEKKMSEGKKEPEMKLKVLK
jgi:hypothetical protein